MDLFDEITVGEVNEKLAGAGGVSSGCGKVCCVNGRCIVEGDGYVNFDCLQLCCRQVVLAE
jgi:hypothetical protein